MKTIILYGELANRFGKYHRFAVRNAGEAIRALRANFKGFEQYMCGAHLDGVGFKVFIGGHSIGSKVEEIHHPSSDREIIRIVPVLAGSGSGWSKIIIGAILVAAAVVATALTAGSASPLLATAIQSAGLIGASLIIGGIAQLLTKTPDNNSGNNRNSHIFSGPQNTVAVGNPVPVVYGRMMVGSCVISAGITTVDTPN